MNQLWKKGALAALVALAALAAVAAPLAAQLQTGNVFGTVADDKGQALPGVTVTLSGGGAPVVSTSDGEGNFRFVGVSPGTYKLESTLDGFSPVVYEQVVVNVNRNTTLNLTMNAAVADVITITGESPLLDTRKISTGATVDKTELEKIPTARDPWVILQTTPGVLVDRVNVGGNESGQQSGLVGNGDDGRNTTWSIDGVEITDVGAIGSSSSYYDFDAFEEINVATGGSDAAARTGGVGLNMVTKRGTNEWRGSGRYITDKDSWQSGFSPSAGDFGKAGAWNQNKAQAAFKAGNRIVEVQDYGAEIGGPIVKDKLWIWGSYGKNKIDLLTVSDFADKTQLESWNGKLNWQIAQNNSASVFYFKNDKTKQGRNASPTRTQPTTWNQGPRSSDPDLFSFFSERPDVFKLEDTHILGSNFFLTGMYSESDGGFSLTPQGGIGDGHANANLNLSTGVWTRTFVDYYSLRPQNQLKADGSYFFSTGNLNHELKFGANYRKAEVRSLSRWPGFGVDYSVGSANTLFYTSAIADNVLNYDVKYENVYLQDTLTSGNLTANVGLRYDIQSGEQTAGSTRAVPGFEAYLPAYSVSGGSPGFGDWKDFQPRLGLTYALGAEKKTLLRASYSRFVDQLSGAAVGQTYPIYPAPYVGFYAYDTNGNGKIDPSEIVDNGCGLPCGHGPSWDPNTGQLVATNAVDPNLKAPSTDELVVGVEHALLPEFVVGLTATWRKTSDLLETETLVFDGDPYSTANAPTFGRKATAADWVVGKSHTVVLPDGSTRTVPIYSLRSGVKSRGGTLLENSDSSQDYLGVALTVNKRLSNRWMMRGNVSWNDWKWNVPAAEAANNPQTPVGGGNDGDRVVTCVGSGSGAKAGICISSSWSYSMSGMYQVAPDRPWGFNVAASLNGHEGYSDSYFIRGRRSGFPLSAILTSATGRPDDYKNGDVHVLDLRIEKEFKHDRFGLTLGADVFNALNASTVLQRNLRLDYPTRTDSRDAATTGDHVAEVLSPRIFRVGVKLTFN